MEGNTFSEDNLETLFQQSFKNRDSTAKQKASSPKTPKKRPRSNKEEESQDEDEERQPTKEGQEIEEVKTKKRKRVIRKK